MKDQLNGSQSKLVSLEEGYLDANDSISNLKSRGKGGASKCMIRLVYLIPILVFFLGWYSYTAWQAYRTEQIEMKKIADRLSTSVDVRQDLLSYKIPKTFDTEAVLFEYTLKNAEDGTVPKETNDVEVVQREPTLVPFSTQSSVNHEENDKSISKVLEDTPTTMASIAESDDTVEEQNEGPNSFALKQTRDWADLAFLKTSKISLTEMSSTYDDASVDNSDWSSEKSDENSAIDVVEAKETGDSTTTTELPTRLESTGWSGENEENEGQLIKDAKTMEQLDSIVTKNEVSQPTVMNGYLCTVKPWALLYYVEYRVIIRMCEYQSSASLDIETTKEGTKSDVKENQDQMLQDHAWKDEIDERKMGFDDNGDSSKRDELTSFEICDDDDDEEDPRELEDLESSVATAPAESGQNSETLSVRRCPEKDRPDNIFGERVAEELAEDDTGDSVQVKRYLFQFIMPDLGRAELNVVIEEESGIKSSDRVELVDEDARKELQDEDVVSVTTLKSSIDGDDEFEYQRYDKFMNSEMFSMDKDDSSDEERDEGTANLGLESAEFDKGSNDREDLTVESASFENEELRDMAYGDDYDDILSDLEDDILYDPEFTYENIRKRSIEQRPWNSGGQLNLVPMENEPAQLLRDAVQLGKDLLVRKMEQNFGDDQQFQRSNLKEFFEKMDILSAHIDRLHERYLRMNQLNDDYISKEFSLESVETS